MDIYSYFNSKTVGEYCRSIGHQFNAYESAFIINDCKRISFEEKITLFDEIMHTMPDVTHKRLESYMGDDSFFRALRHGFIHDNYIHAYQFYKNGEKYKMVYQFGFHFGSQGEYLEDSDIYTTYDRALAALKERIKDCEPGEYTGLRITGKQLDTGKYITGCLNDDLEVSSIEHNLEERVPLFDEIWVYIPTPFKKGDILIPCGTEYQSEPMVLNNICYWDKDEKWIENSKVSSDSSDMVAYGYWVDDDGHLYDECVHDLHNLEYFDGELCICEKHTYRYRDLRLLKAVSGLLKGKIDPHMLLIANDAIRKEREYRECFPFWDYTDDCYKKAGIEDIIAKRRLWRDYDIERYIGRDNE